MTWDCWKFISNTLSDCRSIGCTSFVCSGREFSWNFRVSWGIYWDWVLWLSSRLSFYYCFPVVENYLEKYLDDDRNKIWLDLLYNGKLGEKWVISLIKKLKCYFKENANTNVKYRTNKFSLSCPTKHRRSWN